MKDQTASTDVATESSASLEAIISDNKIPSRNGHCKFKSIGQKKKKKKRKKKHRN